MPDDADATADDGDEDGVDADLRAAEQLFEDEVLYVATQGAQVRGREGRIVVHDVQEDEELGSFPIEQIDTVNVFGNVNFTTPFAAKASERGIAINYFSSNRKYRGTFLPEKNTIAAVRRKQYGVDDDTKLSIAKEIIGAKIQNGRVLLRRKGVEGLGTLEDHAERIDTVRTMDGLRGIEGEAADDYFQLLDEALIDGWTFESRSRRPPEDHINSLLSLTYVMMKNEVMASLREYNLDPFLGVMHVDRHGRPALALDLLEEVRGIFCDAFTIRLVNRGTLTHDDFRKDNKLRDDSFSTYLEKFDDYMQEEFTHPHFGYKVTRRKALKLQAILLRKRIVGENRRYYPLAFQK